MSCHLGSKSSGAFNFIGMFALELCANSHNQILKITQHALTSKTDVEDAEKRKHKWKHVIYVALNIKKQSASRFYYESLKFQFFDVAFLFLSSVFVPTLSLSVR